MTPEQRAAALDAARVAREAKRLAWEADAHLLKQDFADRNHWLRLAAHYGVRMPATNAPGTETRLLRRVMRKCGLTGDNLTDVFGSPSPARLAPDNPTWPAWALTGLLLEVAAERDSL